MSLVNKLSLALLVLAVCLLAAGWVWTVPVEATDARFVPPKGYEMPFGPLPFAPSNARTTTGQLISSNEFIPARRCANCHESTHAEWKESAHRNAFREPFYQANVQHLIRDRGIAVTRHCESCHNPVALFSGALSPNVQIERPFDDEGVSCSVCHSIQSTTTEGIGSYTIAPPALLELANGQRIKDATDEQVLADLPSHSRAMMRPLLKQPEFCAACHKAAVVRELNNRKWFRTFSVFDEWQQSSFAGETVQPISNRPYENCQTCHMPQQQSTGYVLHRWPGGNTAIPAHYGWPNQVNATANLLKSGLISVDIFALLPRPSDPSASIAPIEDSATVKPGQTVSVDVVVANRGVGHSFPAELRDMFEAWLEFKAIDATGKILLHSGAVNADGTLEWSAHAYRAVPIGSDGQPITRHDIWNTRTGAFDRFIPPGRADVGRFTFAIPSTAKAPIRIVAKLNYRRFNSRFIDWVARTEKVNQSPVVEMTSATSSLYVGTSSERSTVTGPANPKTAGDLRKRWRTYGVALFDQQQYEAAGYAFEKALHLAPKNSADEAASCVDLALAYMRIERAGSAQTALETAAKWISRALEIAPESGRARYYRALIQIKQFRYGEALADLERLAREQPRDRQIWTQLAALYLIQRRDKDSLLAYEHVLSIDPDDTEAHFKLEGLYWRFGLTDLAKLEQQKYQARHLDTVGETLRRTYLKANADLYLTWPWREFGDNPIGSLP